MPLCFCFLKSVLFVCLHFPFDNSVTVWICFLPSFVLFPVLFFPFIHLVPIFGISSFRDRKDFVEIMHRLESISLDYPRQTNFEKVYFLILRSILLCSSPFFVNFANPFRLSRSSSNSLRSLSASKIIPFWRFNSL